MYAIKDDILYKLEGRDRPSWKTYIPSSLEDEIILNFHTGLGHSGVERVMLILRSTCTSKDWPIKCANWFRNVRYASVLNQSMPYMMSNFSAH